MPTRLAAPTAVDELLLYRLNRLLATASTAVIRLCEGRFGITRREWRLIAHLAREGELMSSQLAERAQLDRARTSRAITSLVAKKLVQRRAAPADRRQVYMTLTPRGRALHEELFPLVRDINRELLAGIDATQVEALDQLLEAMQSRADAIAARGDWPKADRRRGGRDRATLG